MYSDGWESRPFNSPSSPLFDLIKHQLLQLFPKKIVVRPGGKIIDEAAFTDNILLFTSIRKATIPNSPSAHSYSNSLTNSSSANLTSIQSRIKEQDDDHQKEKKMGMTSEYTFRCEHVIFPSMSKETI